MTTSTFLPNRAWSIGFRFKSSAPQQIHNKLK